MAQGQHNTTVVRANNLTVTTALNFVMYYEWKLFKIHTYRSVCMYVFLFLCAANIIQCAEQIFDPVRLYQFNQPYKLSPCKSIFLLNTTCMKFGTNELKVNDGRNYKRFS